MTKCTVENCDHKELARGLCTGHYKQWAKNQELTDLRPKAKKDQNPILCTNPDKKCIRETYSRGLCKSCYEIKRNQKKKKNKNDSTSNI